MIKTNNNNSNPSSPPTRTSISPLPFVSPPPRAHRPSFSRRLRASSFLFPKTLSSPRMMIDGSDGNKSHSNSRDSSHDNSNNERKDGRASATAGSSGGTLEKENIGDHHGHRPAAYKGGARGKTTSNNIVSSSFILPNKPLPAKKMARFRFQDKSSIVIHLLHDIPIASQMTPHEKSKMWYTPSEHDQFKYDAAKHAGVKIVRYDNKKEGMGHHFVMMGDFDGREGAKIYCSGGSGGGSNDASSGTNKTGAAAAQTTTTTTGKRYYNENEYNDRFNSSEIICKRGLGYHFSRCRKHARIVTRSAVVAWQRTLNDPSNTAKVEQDLPSVGSSSMSTTTMRENGSSDGKIEGKDKEVKQEKDRMMLALVSAKCSRASREEARWRGDVDYRVAYPERHATVSRSKKVATAFGGAHKDDGSTKGGMKDNGRMARTTSGMKRAATGSGNHRNPSPVHSSSSPSCADQSNKRQRRNAATVGYLSGILHAEV